MTETYSLGLSLLDFVPNIAFLIGAYFLVALTLRERNRPCARMLMGGALLVFSGGVLKATWKLLFATGVGDFQLFSQIQFVLLAPGFLAMLITVILLAREKRAQGVLPAAIAIAPWKIPLLAVMTISNLGALGILIYIAFRKKITGSAVFYIIAFLCIMGMAGMASGEQTVARQWIEEITNSIGQISFALGSFVLHQKFKC